MAAAGVDQREGRVLGPVPGRVQHTEPDRTQLELVAIGERCVCVAGLSVAMDVDRRPGRSREPPVARHVIGVVVRLEDVLDAHAHVARELEVLVDLEARVDDGRDPGLLVADEVGGAAEVVVGDLAEDHEAAPCCSRAYTQDAESPAREDWNARACTNGGTTRRMRSALGTPRFPTSGPGYSDAITTRRRRTHG